MALNDKQRRFVAEYLVSLNGTKAAIAAGYSEATAYSYANALLKREDVQAEIAEQEEARHSRLLMTADRVEEELAQIALDHDVHVATRVKALELLGKRHALFTDNVNQVGERNVRVVWGQQ